VETIEELRKQAKISTRAYLRQEIKNHKPIEWPEGYWTSWAKRKSMMCLIASNAYWEIAWEMKEGE